MEAAALRSTLLVDLGLVGALLLLGVVLRAKVPVVQWLMLPAPVIAGIIGFLLGPNVMGVWTWSVPFSDYIGSYTTMLIAIVFACMALAQDFGISNLTGDLGRFTGYGILMSAGQVFVGMLLAMLILGPVFDAPMSMGLILFAAWSGGFGTSAAMGDVFAANGQSEITSVAFTAATVGMLTGVVGGVILARIGAVRGHATAVDMSDALPHSLRTGLLEGPERKSNGVQTTSGSSIESLTFHIALIGTVVAVGLVLQTSSADILNAFALPLFATAFLVGMVFRWVLRRSGASRYVDRATMKSLSGSASDVLIVCAMVSIEPTFVRDHLASLLLIFVLGVVFCVLLGLVFAPRYLGDYWFEKQIFTWGWATGSVATGITLLRIVDPDLESGTVEDFGYAYLPLIPIEGAAVAVAPLLVIAGLSWSVALIWGVLALVGAWILVHGRKTASTSS